MPEFPKYANNYLNRSENIDYKSFLNQKKNPINITASDGTTQLKSEESKIPKDLQSQYKLMVEYLDNIDASLDKFAVFSDELGELTKDNEMEGGVIGETAQKKQQINRLRNAKSKEFVKQQKDTEKIKSQADDIDIAIKELKRLNKLKETPDKKRQKNIEKILGLQQDMKMVNAEFTRENNKLKTIKAELDKLDNEYEQISSQHKSESKQKKQESGKRRYQLSKDDKQKIYEQKLEENILKAQLEEARINEAYLKHIEMTKSKDRKTLLAKEFAKISQYRPTDSQLAHAEGMDLSGTGFEKGLMTLQKIAEDYYREIGNELEKKSSEEANEEIFNIENDRGQSEEKHAEPEDEEPEDEEPEDEEPEDEEPGDEEPDDEEPDDEEPDDESINANPFSSLQDDDDDEQSSQQDELNDDQPSQQDELNDDQSEMSEPDYNNEIREIFPDEIPPDVSNNPTKKEIVNSLYNISINLNKLKTLYDASKNNINKLDKIEYNDLVDKISSIDGKFEKYLNEQKIIERIHNKYSSKKIRKSVIDNLSSVLTAINNTYNNWESFYDKFSSYNQSFFGAKYGEKFITAPTGGNIRGGIRKNNFGDELVSRVKNNMDHNLLASGLNYNYLLSNRKYTL